MASIEERIAHKCELVKRARGIVEIRTGKFPKTDDLLRGIIIELESDIALLEEIR